MNIILFVVMFSKLIADIYSQDCETKKLKFKEGNWGKTGDFPWLGILRLTTHDKKPYRTYLSGIVMVRHNYAIGNANDLAKVSTYQLRHDAKGMFLITKHLVWSSKVKDCIIHPEHDYTTTSTVAVIIFDDTDESRGAISPTPVCLFHRQINYNTYNDLLYLVKYTDERILLDKAVHRMNIVPNDLCLEYYKRTQFPSNKTWPAKPLCAYSAKIKHSCLWDNAMALVYDHNGTSILIGIGVFGPGCGVPSRYIEIYPYIPWIQSVIKMQGELF